MIKTLKTKSKTFWIIFAISILVIFEVATYISTGSLLLCGRYGNCSEVNIQKGLLANTITYECADKGFIQAQFYTDDTVNLEAYKNSEIILKEKLNLEGEKYANKSKTILFWSESNEQMSTFLEKDGAVILSCKFQSSGE